MRVVAPIDSGIFGSIKMTIGGTDLDGDIMRTYIGVEPFWCIWWYSLWDSCLISPSCWWVNIPPLTLCKKESQVKSKKKAFSQEKSTKSHYFLTFCWLQAIFWTLPDFLFYRGSLMVSETFPGVPPHGSPPASTKSALVSSPCRYMSGMMMTGGWFLSHTSECIHPRFSPCTWGGIGSSAGDVEGKGCKSCVQCLKMGMGCWWWSVWGWERQCVQSLWGLDGLMWVLRSVGSMYQWFHQQIW